MPGRAGRALPVLAAILVPSGTGSGCGGGDGTSHETQVRETTKRFFLAVSKDQGERACAYMLTVLR